jgi:predicted amidohydrolase
MRVAAYQCPLLPPGSMDAIDLMRRQVKACESEGISILCGPEAVLGGLADDARIPADLAFEVGGGRLEAVLSPLASDSVTTIVGFTEAAAEGRLYNAAAVYHRGAVVGVYRKRSPAIRRSVYRAGDEAPVFAVGGLTFGIVICNDSNFPEPARALESRGARVLFVPSNNALPPEKADVVADARRVDAALAKEFDLTVIRADVAGRIAGRISYGSTGITAPDGTLLGTARPFAEALVVADLGLGRVADVGPEIGGGSPT